MAATTASSSSGLPTAESSNATSTATSSARPTSSSTLPAIRSLRKAFQFSNSSNKHHSVDGYAAAANEDFRRSTGSTRTFSGSLPRPTASYPRSSSTTITITKSSSASNINALTGPGTAAASALSPGPSSSNENSDGIKNVQNNQSYIDRRSARPVSVHAILEHHTVIYNSSIPVNSKPASSTTSAKSSPLHIAVPKKQPTPIQESLLEATKALAQLTASDTPSVTPTDTEGDDELTIPIMHITQFKGSTPPPLIPLPPVPDVNEQALHISEARLPPSTKRTWPTLKNHMESIGVPRSREASSVSILDETAPEALEQAEDLSISSPPPLTAPRPTISRSRSAIESIRAIAAEADILETGSLNGSSGRSRQSSLPKPVIMDSPSRSPAVMDANKAFNFPASSSAERLDASVHEDIQGQISPLPRLSTGETSLRNSGDQLQDSTYLRGIRHSSTSPLSELVQRLNSQASSPVKDEDQSHRAFVHDMDNSEIRSEEDQSESHYSNGIPGSPFIAQSMLDEEEGNSNIEDGSVAESSGISVAPSSRLSSQHLQPQSVRPYARTPRQEQTLERSHARTVNQEQDLRISTTGSIRQTHRQESENRISPQTEKRWSMAEVEAAYGRIRKLATRRSSAVISDAPSFLISEDSKDLAPSYVQHLLDRGFPLDASMTSSDSSRFPSGPASHTGYVVNTPRLDGPSQEVDLFSSTDREEAGDALTPLVGRERYSPSTSPRIPPRDLSPHMSGRFTDRKSPRNSFVETRNDSPYSSGTGSSSRGNSNGSAALTAPTTARHSQESNVKLPYPPPQILRSASDQNERSVKPSSRTTWLRRASAEGSSAASSGAGSDDTGWVTPKTSAGDIAHRRRSVSPALTATRRGSSGSALEHYDDAPHHTTTAANLNARRASSTRIRRPVSYSSSGGTDSLPGGQYGRSGSYRYTHGPSHSASHSSLWFDDTPKAMSKTRPGIPSDFRGSMATHPHRREASSYSTSGSTYSLDSLATSSFAEAKKADKIDLFLRCTKAEAALQAITAHSQIEREALLDALQESRAMIDALRQQNEELIADLEHMRRAGNRKPAEQSQEAARRVAEIVEARDEWQARAQAMERDLAATKRAQQKSERDHEAALAAMKKEMTRLQDELAARLPRSPPKNVSRATSGLPRKSSPGSNSLKASISPSGLPRSTSIMNSSGSRLPRSRHSLGTNSNGFSPHGRTISNASSTVQTDFGDHLPASSDGWSLGDSQDASLRLDDSTARFLQDIEGHSNRSRQKRVTSAR